jgi:hypothetical protein
MASRSMARSGQRRWRAMSAALGLAGMILLSNLRELPRLKGSVPLQPVVTWGSASWRVVGSGKAALVLR